MGIINKIFSSVNGLYNNINPITLSGVNDVIVIRNGDGRLCCSPFQLRFSKLKFYNSKSKTVHLYVNGKLTDINMTITSMGDLFFEQQRAVDEVDYEKVVNYLESNEVSIGTILATRVNFEKKNTETTSDEHSVKDSSIRNGDSSDEVGGSDDLAINYNDTVTERIPSLIKKTNIDNDRVSSIGIELDGNTISYKKHRKDKRDNNVDLSNAAFEDIFQQKRIENLTLRLFAKNNIVKYFDEIYSVLSTSYNKVNSLLNSAEHYASLLDKQKLLLYFLESAINNNSSVSLSFSACLNNRIEKSVDDTFMGYLTKEIDDPDNTVIKIEGVIGGKSIGVNNYEYNDSIREMKYRTSKNDGVKGITESILEGNESKYDACKAEGVASVYKSNRTLSLDSINETLKIGNFLITKLSAFFFPTEYLISYFLN